MLTPTTPLDRLRSALQDNGGTVPPDLIEPLRDLLSQLDHATSAADRAAEHFPHAADVVKRSAYRAASLDMVLDEFARLREVAPLAAGTGG